MTAAGEPLGVAPGPAAEIEHSPVGGEETLEEVGVDEELDDAFGAVEAIPFAFTERRVVTAHLVFAHVPSVP